MSTTTQTKPPATQEMRNTPLNTQHDSAPTTEPDTPTIDVKHADGSINYARFVSEGQGLHSVASVGRDGRISVHFDLKKDARDLHKEHAHDEEEFAVDKTEWKECPNMNILIMIVGSRGDVQPYVALGKRFLKDGHRVRIATHETFRQFVTEAGLEFFNIGGDPQDLMSYMVKNPGLMPGFASLTNGDILRKRGMLTEMIDGCWLSCHAPCPVSGRSFAADAIISNPPAFAHIHCAEALGIPLLLSFTMPWSPTVAFAHPLVNIAASNAGNRTSNYLSYAAADLLTWQGIGDIVNAFRTKKLGLHPLSILTGPGYVDRLKVPWTYCMSPALVPKPGDWNNHIDVVGFYFLDLATSYKPPPDLVAFLATGDPPVYIGFGSVVVDDPAALSKIIFDATEQAGVRALVSAGWGGLGGTAVPPHIFMLGNIPHDWLFDKERVAAVVHHGGAGTTAIGLANGRPTVIVPFFGDQAFWGHMIYKAGAGPKPIHHKDLTVKKLNDALKFAISPAAKKAAATLAAKIREEKGIDKGAEMFYQHLPLLNMRCDLDPSRLAVWWSATHCLKLSAFAAQTLADAKLLTMRSLVLHRPKEYKPKKKAAELANGGGAGAVFWSLTHETKLGGTLSSTMAKADNAYNTSCSIIDAVTSIHEGWKKSASKPEAIVSEEKSKPIPSPPTSPASNTQPDRINVTRPSLIGAIKNLVQGKKSDLDLLDIPVQDSWKKMLKSCQIEYDCQRLTRIAEGCQAVHGSRDAERAHIVARFHAENAETPLRQELYRSAVVAKELAGSMSTDSQSESSGKRKKSLNPGESFSSMVQTIPEERGRETLSENPQHSISGLTLVGPPQKMSEEDETALFIREMDMALELSLQEHERGWKTSIYND